MKFLLISVIALSSLSSFSSVNDNRDSQTIMLGTKLVSSACSRDNYTFKDGYVLVLNYETEEVFNIISDDNHPYADIMFNTPHYTGELSSVRKKYFSRRTLFRDREGVDSLELCERVRSQVLNY